MKNNKIQEAICISIYTVYQKSFQEIKSIDKDMLVIKKVVKES